MSMARRFLGSRRSGFAAALITLALAVSCGLSPVPVLPSATDGSNIDGSSDGLDGIVGGSGGKSSSGSGGAPPCTLESFYECRGHERWSIGPVAGCTVEQKFLEACTYGCDTYADGVAACAIGGAAGAAGAAGSAGSGSDESGR